jgi:hypothetical protein
MAASVTRWKIWAAVAGVAIVAALVMMFPAIVGSITHRTSPLDDGSLPPAFYGNRAAYCVSLFALFSMSSLALRNILVTSRRLRDEPWRADPDLGLYRMSRIMLNLVIVFVAAPDVVVLFLWGEVSDATMRPLRTFAQIFDGLALVPFFVSTFVIIKADQLEHVPNEPATRPDWHRNGSPRPGFFLILPRTEGLADHVRIIAFVLVIALGLALFK